MAIDNLLHQTCTVYEDSLVKEKGEQVRTRSIIYEDIPCSLYNVNFSIKNREDSQKTDWSNTKLIVSSDKTLIRSSMEVVVSDQALGEIGKFLVDGPIPQRDRNGSLHHIELSLSNKVR